jgi:hypothetical protein
MGIWSKLLLPSPSPVTIEVFLYPAPVVYTAGTFAVPKLSAACVPWGPRFRLPPQANLSYGYLPLGPGLATRQKTLSHLWQEGNKLTVKGGPMEMMRWYNPLTMEEEEVSAPMSDAQAIEIN